MSPRLSPNGSGKTGFRWKLLVAMMVVVSGITAIAIYIAQRNVAAEVSGALQREFEEKVASLHTVQEVRHAVLAERCRTLVRKPRIHAALEDNALDLLYPSAQDELRDVIEALHEFPDGVERALHAEFYRFLDMKGDVLRPESEKVVGALTPEEEKRLALKVLPRAQQLGYIPRSSPEEPDGSLSEVIAVPITSTETGEPISALVLGFKPLSLASRRTDFKSGIWVEGKLHLPLGDESAAKAVENDISQVAGSAVHGKNRLTVKVAGVPHLLFYSLLNPGSFYSPAYEVCVFSLTDLLLRQRQIRWQILSAGGLMLLAGFAASHYFSGKLSVPVEKLAVDSETNRAGREQAEAALELTSEELQRSVRFSADASHQLKTPVAVMRAGLEELLARDNLTPELRQEVSDLIHQSFRLSGVVDDLLLLSRMDAGRLQLQFALLNLSLLLESELDDLSAQPNPLNVTVETDFPPDVLISGEKRYTTLIVRNLLENALKYNSQGGRIRVTARAEAAYVLLSISNSGRPIPAAVQGRIFERFHRGVIGENVPGHGLGLNLARELARLHGGDLRLVRSQHNWTEFEVRFRAAVPETVGI